MYIYFIFQTLVEMMESYRYFGEALDRTCNIHTDQWNLMAVKKALPLIDNKVFRYTTFPGHMFVAIGHNVTSTELHVNRLRSKSQNSVAHS